MARYLTAIPGSVTLLQLLDWGSMCSRVAASFLLCLSVLQFPLSGQQSATTPAATIQRDPQAITLVQQSLAAMGTAQALLLGDSVATGQAQIFKPDGTSATFPITKKSIGTTMVRTELQRPEGTQVRVMNGGAAAIQMASGSIRPLVANNTMAERVEHIPALSILCEWGDTNMELVYLGADTVNGQAADVVSVSQIPANAQDSSFWRSMTQTLFYIDRSTKFVSKVQYQKVAENNTNLSEKVEIFFSNYRAVSGVFVPFQYSTYSDGRLLTTVAFSSVSFNTGLAATDFNLPVAN